MAKKGLIDDLRRNLEDENANRVGGGRTTEVFTCKIASGSNDGTMRIWIADTGTRAGKPLIHGLLFQRPIQYIWLT